MSRGRAEGGSFISRIPIAIFVIVEGWLQGAQPASDTRQSTAWPLEIVRKADIIIEVSGAAAQLPHVQDRGAGVHARSLARSGNSWVVGERSGASLVGRHGGGNSSCFECGLGTTDSISWPGPWYFPHVGLPVTAWYHFGGGHPSVGPA